MWTSGPEGSGVVGVGRCRVGVGRRRGVGVGGRPGLSVAEGVSIGGRGCGHLDDDGVGAGRGDGRLGPSRCTLGVTGLRLEEVALGVGEDGGQPVGEFAAWRQRPCRPGLP